MLSRLRQAGQILSVVLELFGAIVLMGCGAATTVTPLIRAGDTLTKPDRLLVYDFEVTPGEMDLERGFTAAISPGGSSDAQTDEEIQVGKAMAEALTGSVVRELRSRGIENVYRAADASAPGQDTASIKGRFLRLGQGGRTIGGFSLGSGQVRTHIWMFQGAGLTLRLVAENETATPSDLKRGIGTGLGSGESTFAAVETDASRIAKEVADRVIEYSRRRGWVD